MQEALWPPGKAVDQEEVRQAFNVSLTMEELNEELLEWKEMFNSVVAICFTLDTSESTM